MLNLYWISLLLLNCLALNGLIAKPLQQKTDQPISSALELKAKKIEARHGMLLLTGGVHARRGDVSLRAPSAELDGDWDRPNSLKCPSMEAEWLDADEAPNLIRCSGPCVLFVQEHRMTLRAAPGERLRWINLDQQIECREAILQFCADGWSLESADLTGDLWYRQQAPSDSSLLSQGWAETAHLTWPKMEIVLEAAAPKTVRLWNRSTTQELCCHRLILHRDSITKEWMHRGDGGVHVRLAVDELRPSVRGKTSVEEELDEDDEPAF